MKRSIAVVFILLAALAILSAVTLAASPWPDDPPDVPPAFPAVTALPTAEVPEAIAEVNDAIQNLIVVERPYTPFFWDGTILVKDTKISSDGVWASSALVSSNIRSEEPPGTEPALAISTKVDGEWQVFFPNHPDWLKMLQSVPDELLSVEHKINYTAMNYTPAVSMPAAALSGYLLPWDAGVSYYLTGSTCHDDYIPSGNAHYAFDFAYNRTMWDILAVKDGVVWVWKDNAPTCYEPSCWDHPDQATGNYIVIKDDTTSPPTYHQYLHLKADSIPDEIKERGHPIKQGQFIGIVDNTGQSSGSHLHFQVQVPYLGEDHYWGRSVDITFDDVDINGGRPRINQMPYCWDFKYCDRSGDVCETSQLYYTSQNERYNPNPDNAPPEGGIFTPETGETHNATLALSGWANDVGTGEHPPSGIEYAQFQAYFDNAWHPIGPKFSEMLFDYDWDWCASTVPDGPVSVALEIQDNEGNRAPVLTGLRHVTKDYACLPTPACQPNEDQAAIFSQPDFLGDCQILPPGSYPSDVALGVVGGGNTVSVLLGSNTAAQLFTGENYTGRSEFALVSDPNLSDNLVGSRTVTSIKVMNFADALADPTSVENEAPLVPRTNLDPTNTVSHPFTDMLEGDISGWELTGLWHRSTAQAHSASHSLQYAEAGSGTYETGMSNSGVATTPPIALPVSTQPYILQFWTRYDTENSGSHWDRREIQLSVDGGAFIDLHSLVDDPMGGWIEARIDLLPYYDATVPHTIQVRFAFNTVDAEKNAFAGWFIDDVQVMAEPIVACHEDLNEVNDTPAQATSIAYGDVTQGAICPGWDYDYFQFDAAAGDHILADIDARTSGSDLDGYLYLIAADGTSVLAENDDEVQYKLQDPLLGYRIQRTGTYYLRLHAWNHPAGMGPYTLTLSTDDVAPAVQLTNPVESGFIPQEAITITATAGDAGSGMRMVRFIWHDNNWESGRWQEIGTDTNGTDGWSANFDASALPEGKTISIFAMAYDRAGNTASSAAWVVRVDSAPPQVDLQPLTNPATSTVVQVQWWASDAGSGIQRMDLNFRENSGSWIPWLINTQQSAAYYVGAAGDQVEFQVFAQDWAGNQTPSSVESTWIPAVSTLCSQLDAWDINASTNDNSPARATAIAVNDGGQVHNFCSPTATDRLGDEDWLTFTVSQGQPYALSVRPNGDSAAAVISLYAADGTTLLDQKTAADFNQTTTLNWNAASDGVRYAQITHIDDRAAGNGTAYTVGLYDHHILGLNYLPLIYR